MLSGLPKILGRGFIVGFLLPSVLFCLYFQYLSFDLPDTSIINNSIDSLKVTPFILIVLSMSVLLMALNRNIIRTLEGYAVFNPLRVLKFIQVRRWNRDVLPLLEEARRLEEARKLNPAEKSFIENFSIKLISATESYPAKKDSILPTSFGNAMRSFEGYSGIVYELDAIPAWPRLSLSLPKEIKEQVQDGRSIIDFSANLLFLSLFAFPASLYKYHGQAWEIKNTIVISIPLLCAIYAWFNLPTAARQWGVIVKSTIDVSRGRLAKELGLELPESIEKEREMWRYVTRFMLFRSASDYVKLDEFKKKSKDKSQNIKITLQ